MALSCGRPTVAEIDLSALRSNYRALKTIAAPSELMVVVKADAYGHGAVPVVKALSAEGCRHFGVATVEEGEQLRASGIRERVYLLGGFFAEQARSIVELMLIPFIFDFSLIASIEQSAATLGRRQFPVHLKIDTGATRLGIRPEELDAAIERLRPTRSLMVEGVCTLLANAGDPESRTTDGQIELLRGCLERLRSAGFAPPLIHIANSAALVLRQDGGFNLTRPGLAIYGLPPVPAVGERVELRPVMTFKTCLMQVKRVPAGTGVSYGHTFITRRPSIIGIIPVGYGDGYKRGLQHGGEVLIRRRRAPVVGAVCMDLTMVDLTEAPEAKLGDEVILWGGKGEEMISVNELARLVNTISYEMLCTVGKRVPRVYVNGMR